MMNFLVDSKSIEDYVIQIQSRSMSDPTLSDIDFKNKMAWVWTTLKTKFPKFFGIQPSQTSQIEVIYLW